MTRRARVHAYRPTVTSHRVIALLLIAASAVGAAGCDGGTLPPSHPPAPSPPAEPVPATPNTSIPASTLDAWVSFRERYGLRHDVSWVLEVASDPGAVTDLPAPLLPAEVDEMAGRIVGAVPVVEMLERYGYLVPEDFAGAFLDGGVPVARFSQRAGEHERALRSILGDKQFDVRQVTFSFAKLEVWRRQVESDRAWFAGQGLRLDHASVYERENAVRIFYHGNRPAPGSLLLSRHLSVGIDRRVVHRRYY